MVIITILSLSFSPYLNRRGQTFHVGYYGVPYSTSVRRGRRRQLPEYWAASLQIPSASKFFRRGFGDDSRIPFYPQSSPSRLYAQVSTTPHSHPYFSHPFSRSCQNLSQWSPSPRFPMVRPPSRVLDVPRSDSVIRHRMAASYSARVSAMRARLEAMCLTPPCRTRGPSGTF